MNETPTFLNPPIVEFVLGAQFSPLSELTSAFYGKFWNHLGENWGKPQDNPLIADQFERFGEERAPLRWQLKLETAPLVNRLTLINADEDRLLQIQPSRFHLNWRKTDVFKPSYKELISEFERYFNEFRAFCEKDGVGTIEVNQWELTYVDCFPKGAYWDTPSDWGKFLPGLFRIEQISLGEKLQLESRAAQWEMEIQPRLGRLHLSASMGRWRTDQPEALMLNLTARGPLVAGHTPTLRSGLDLGHQVAVDQFLKMVDEEVKNDWGYKDE